MTEISQATAQQPTIDQPGAGATSEPDTLAASPLDGSRPASSQLVPVSESIRYRRRAQQAERRLVELGQQLQAEQAARAAAEARIESSRRRAELARLLAGRNVIDLDAAILLAEDRLAALPKSESGEAGSAKPDPAVLTQMVEQLLQDKPYLAAGSAAAPPGQPAAPTPAAKQANNGQAPTTEGLRQPGTAQAGNGAAPAIPGPTQGRRGSAGPAEQLRTAARQAASGRPADLDNYLKVRRRFA